MIPALLLAMNVVRIAGSSVGGVYPACPSDRICLLVSEIQPEATALCYTNNTAGTQCASIAPGTKDIVIPLYPIGDGLGFWEVYQSKCSGSCDGTHHREKLCCADATGQGCDTTIYHVCVGSEP